MTPALSITDSEEKTHHVNKSASENNMTTTILTLEIKEMALSPADSLALADDDSLEHLLPELGLTLLDGGEEHVTDGTSGEAIELGTDASASDHIQVLGSRVISAVHH